MSKEYDNYITEVQVTHEQFHRSKIIIHRELLMHFADFNDIKQLEKFSKMLGFTYELEEENDNAIFIKIKRYTMSHRIIDPYSGGFWNLDQLPDGVKPFKALSNGSIVTCYFLNDGKNIVIFRPNPNAKNVYVPLELTEHIAHKREFGCY